MLNFTGPAENFALSVIQLPGNIVYMYLLSPPTPAVSLELVQNTFYTILIYLNIFLNISTMTFLTVRGRGVSARAVEQEKRNINKGRSYLFQERNVGVHHNIT